MTLRVFASGSGGNCLLLSGADTNILIDAGISMRRVRKALKEAALKMEEIGGVLITHEHSDHISGLNMLCRHYSFPVFAPETVAEGLLERCPEAQGRINIIPVGESFRIGGMSLLAFHTPHDTPESVGYRVSCGEAVFAVSTDMGTVTEEILQGLRGAQTVLIESNHDEELLRSGPYPAALKRRILSSHGHLSNADCALLASELSRSGTEKIVLGHLSRENNSPRLAREAAESALAGSGTELYVAPELGLLELQVEGRQ